MNIIDEILLNQYAQGVVTVEPVLERFNLLSLDAKKHYLAIFIGYFIIQAKPVDNDIEQAISDSKLKPTYTPCVLLRKGVATHHLLKIANLPEYELNKVMRLFLALFRIAYLRRYTIEKGNPNDTSKWWYWDLSKQENIDIILKQHQ
ncbi:DUF5958 family protein [Bacteroides sp. 519]|uniref:DUF5958 family protein n=1 Tax=Bacteroides sp. 519 TaxID=2302937 RepID=UPI0013D4409D|nr:DUF5958 family protein [Bacteroides sp. 519]NDV58961.1 hypothetical protein [Bacteroides sp. 519]